MAATPHPAPTDLAARRWGAASAVALVAAIGVLVPFRPQVDAAIDLDASWRQVLSWAHTQPVEFGRDLVFTYGPWGFALGDGWLPGTYAGRIGFRLLLAVAFVGAWTSLARRVGCRPLPTLCGSVVVGAVGHVGWLNSFCFALPVLLAALHGYRSPRRVDAPLLLLAGACAFASLSKFSNLIATVPIVVLLTIVDAARRRRPAVGIAFAVALPLAWLGAGQPLRAVPGWLAMSWEVARGYDEAMSVGAISVLMVALYAIGAVTTCGAVVLAGRGGARSSALVTTTASAFVFALGWKAGFVRCDWGHLLIPATLLIVLPMVVWPTVRAGGGVGLRLALVGVVGCGWIAIDRTYADAGMPQRLLRGSDGSVGVLPARARAAIANFGAAWDLVRGRTPWLAEHDAATAAIASLPLPAVVGSVDLYGYSQAQLILSQHDYRPRPVFQGYSVYTRRLAECNAAVLRGPTAPDMLLVAMSAADGRLPALEDALAWPEMLARYEPRELVASLLSLRRSDAARPLRSESLATVRAAFQAFLAVPTCDQGPIRATVMLQRWVRGALVGALLRPPAVLLRARTDAGEVVEHRFLPAIGALGFLLNPIVATPRDFADLFLSPGQQAPPPERRVRAIAFALADGADPERWYEDGIEIAFDRLVVPPVATPLLWELAGENDRHRAAGHLLAGLVATAAASAGGPPARLFTDQDRAPALLAHPPMVLDLPVPSGARVLEVGYGLRREVHDRCRPVRFRVQLTSGDGGTVAALDQVVDPARNPADRTILAARIDLPAAVRQVRLETLAVDGTNWAWACWRDLRFE